MPATSARSKSSVTCAAPKNWAFSFCSFPRSIGGFGGGAFDVYCVCEEMARIDLGIATAVLATFLGSDPITVGATPEQKKFWLSRIAEEGLLFAYGATEPEAGSDLGCTADHGGARHPRRPCRRVQNQRQQTVDQQWRHRRRLHCPGEYARRAELVHRGKGRAGFQHDKPENKHGIRLSNTAALSFSDVYVDADRLVGGVEGQGLIQAQAVFGYTRLMVAAFGLGAGWAALDRAIPYSTKRIQAGSPLSEKQGYTHKLIVPNVAAWKQAALTSRRRPSASMPAKAA